MLKLFKKEKKNNKGFTLVELVVVVAILAILVGLLAPQYTKYVERSRKAADASNLDNLVKALEVAVADTTYSDIIPNTDDATVMITINAGGTGVTYNGDTTKPFVNDALKEYAGAQWNSTQLKSKAWPKNMIKATLIISTSGSVTVEYDPAELKKSVELK